MGLSLGSGILCFLGHFEQRIVVRPRQAPLISRSALNIDRLETDQLFFNDIFRTLLAGGVGIVQAAALAFSYFAAVRIAGSDAYQGNGQNN